MAYRRRRGTQTDRDVAGRLPTSADPLVAPDPNRLQIHYDREWNEAVEDLQEGLGNYERNRRGGSEPRPGRWTEDDVWRALQRSPGLLSPVLDPERGRATEDDVRRYLMYLESIGLGRQ